LDRPPPHQSGYFVEQKNLLPQPGIKPQFITSFSPQPTHCTLRTSHGCHRSTTEDRKLQQGVPSITQSILPNL